MSDRFKYSHNGICKIQNVPQTIETDIGPTEWPIKVNDFYCGIYLIHNVKHKSLLSAAILTRSDLSESMKTPPKTPVFLNILSKNPQFRNKFKIETFAKGGKPLAGPAILISDVLDSKNGFLDENGAMTIEFGFHFDGIFDENQEIWKFNLKCKTFDGESKKNMIIYKGPEILYSHKQLILFHDSNSKISNEKNIIDILVVPDTIKMNAFENFLQIAHGVQLQLAGTDLMDVIRIAHRYGIQNVLKYCENQLIMKLSEFPKEHILEAAWHHLQLYSVDLVLKTVKFNLNDLLAHLLKVLSEHLKRALILYQIAGSNEITNESMKTIVAHFLYKE